MSQIKAIKCPKCAAPLNLLGGGRVKTITCAYCKSILDIDQEFQVLGNFKKIQHEHEVPFEIGMQGVLEGIEYTIIGRVTYTQEYNEFFWDDFLLFSPLYGYAWLTYEKGHTLYSKRERQLPLLLWEDMNRTEEVMLKETKYKVLEPYTAKIIYIEGELTWVAKKHDKVKIIDMYAPRMGISMEKSNNEIEFYTTKYIENSTVYEAFDVPKDEQIENNGVHELLEFGEKFFQPFLKIALIGLALILLLIAIASFTLKADTILSFSASSITPISKKFTISDEHYLNTLTLRTSSKEALNNFNILIKDKEQTLFSINRSTAYLSPKIATLKGTKLPTWEPYAKEVQVYINLPKGEYSLNVTAVNGNFINTIHLKLKERVVRFNYFVWMMIFMGVGLIIYWIKKRTYLRKLDEEDGSFFATIFTYLLIFPFLAILLFKAISTLITFVAGV